jgi:putative ABC transport system permease protein
LLRQLLTESLSLALFGGVAGLLLAYWGLNVLNAIVPQNKVPRLEKFSLDLRVLGFTLLVSIVVGVIVGLLPGLRASELNLSETLKDGGRVLSAPSGRRLRNLFVVLEITLTVPLLISAGLMLRSSLLLQSMDRGMNLKNVLTLQISLPQAKYNTADQVTAFYRRILERIQTEPGVESVGAVNFLPLINVQDATVLTVEGGSLSPEQEIPVAYRVIDQNYFRTLGIPLLRGRYFTEQDNDESHGVVLINQATAQRYWPNESPMGNASSRTSRRLKFPGDRSRAIAGLRLSGWWRM